MGEEGGGEPPHTAMWQPIRIQNPVRQSTSTDHEHLELTDTPIWARRGGEPPHTAMWQPMTNQEPEQRDPPSSRHHR
jgi:hypothetical protein